MRTFSHGGVGNAPSTIARLRDRVLRFARWLRDDLAGAVRDRRVVHRLESLSDRELRDIGLWRQDVRDAGLIENGDASRFLMGRRDARRLARDACRRRDPASR